MSDFLKILRDALPEALGGLAVAAIIGILGLIYRNLSRNKGKRSSESAVYQMKHKIKKAKSLSPNINKSEIELKIDRDFDKFTQKEQDKFLSAIKELLGTNCDLKITKLNRDETGINPANISKLIEIAEQMLKSEEKIEQQVVGKIILKGFFGEETVDGLFVATNHRILVVINSLLQGIKKNSFTYKQVSTVSISDNEETITLSIPDEVITLYDLSDVNPYQEPEKFQKYINDKKTPPLKTMKMASDVEILPPPKK